jgi:hypothetical protein
MSWPRKIVSTREIILDKYCQLEAGDEYHHDFHLGQIAKFISGPDHFPPHFPIAGVELFASPVDTAEVSMGPELSLPALVSGCAARLLLLPDGAALCHFERCPDNLNKGQTDSLGSSSTQQCGVY